jgi:hypothetical protein
LLLDHGGDARLAPALQWCLLIVQKRSFESLREAAGLWTGKLIAPLAALISRARHARTFHPVGRTFRARVTVVPGLTAPWDELAARLGGPALARFSGALWRGNFEHWDVLGVALRLRSDETISTERAATDQDLLFATIKSPFTMVASPLTTNAHDYLSNKYWAVCPFEVGQARHVKLRLLPPSQASVPSVAVKEPRNHALVDAVREAALPFRLEARRTFDFSWHTLATVWLLERVDIDQEALRFSPFQTGRQIIPSGFVHAMRRATYAASQRARPTHAH